MRPLLYSINVTLDGCVDHNAIPADEALAAAHLKAVHRHATATIGRADTLLFGRITYQMMEAGWRLDRRATPPEDWQLPFAQAIDAMKKYVVSSTIGEVDWNAELVRGDLGEAVRALKQQPGGPLFTGGVTLPLALAELDLIDEYEFVVQPIIAGHGPRPFAGLAKSIDLKLVERIELSSGAVAMRYQPRR